MAESVMKKGRIAMKFDFSDRIGDARVLLVFHSSLSTRRWNFRIPSPATMDSATDMAMT